MVITIEMAKIFQAFYIQWDADMVDRDRGIQAIVQTSALNEELGQVDYLLTDKTGTLTKNYMEFKKMSIGDFSYGDDHGPPHTEREVTNFKFHDPTFMAHLHNKCHENHLNIVDFLLHLAVCHTVLILEEEDPVTGLPTEQFSAQSPDELALVNAAKKFGVEFRQRPSPKQINISVKLPGDVTQTILKYEILNSVKFDPTRKRATVVVREKNQSNIKVLTKGADSVLSKKLAPG